MTFSTLIATRASADKKARFRALATSRGMDESKLLNLLIDRVLDRNLAPANDSSAFTEGSPRTRITIRLRQKDASLLAERALTRGMRPATYLAALTRAHLRGNPPLPVPELAEVKRLVAELSGVGRKLDRISYDSLGDHGIAEQLAEELRSLREALQSVRAGMTELVKANLRSWESDDA